MQAQWQEEREIWLRWHPEPWTAETYAEYRQRFTDRMEEWLDAGMGDCHLRRRDVRAEVEHCLGAFDAERLDLDAFVLMPNHVHALITPRDGYEIFPLLKGIKGASARASNALLCRTGATFWMEDSYNRIVRDAAEVCAFRNYIEANPGKASLRPEEFTLVLNHALTIDP